MLEARAVQTAGLNLLLRADIFNLFDTVNWDFGDIDINSTTAARSPAARHGARSCSSRRKIEF